MVRVGRCLVSCCPSQRAAVHTAEAPRQEGGLKEQALKAEALLTAPLEAEALQEEGPQHTR